MIGLTACSSDRQQVRTLLERAIAFIEGLHLAEVVNADVEIVDLEVRETIFDVDPEE